MRPARVFSLVVGCLLLLPGIGMVAGGGAMGIGYAVARNDDGYFEIGLDRLQTPTAAIRSEDVDFFADPGSPNWVVDALDVGIQVRAEAVDPDIDIFIGVADRRDVETYLAGTAHDEVVELRDQGVPRYERRLGAPDAVAPPLEQDFWEETAVGDEATLEWDVESGTWAIVLMNADGSRGVAADVDVGMRSDAFLPVAFTLMGLGVLVTALAVTLIVIGARRDDRDRPGSATTPSAVAGIGDSAATHEHPVALSAALDPSLSRWMWLVKWFLAIPHFIVLVFLWVAFVVMTIAAGVAILFTGRYPEGIWRFNLGVLRWGWRVSYYASSGGIGTDRYPPFSLGREPDYPAVLDIAYPERLSRGLVLVKWWLLALPHYVIVALLVGGGYRWTSNDGWSVDGFGAGGLLGLFTLVAGVILLVTGRYPRSLFDLIVGFNRWVYRVIAYAALMTDRYPPFRLDQGGTEPHAPLPPPTFGADEPVGGTRNDAR